MRPRHLLWLVPLLLSTVLAADELALPKLVQAQPDELTWAVAPAGYPAFDSFKAALLARSEAAADPGSIPAVVVPAPADPGTNPFATDRALHQRGAVVAANAETLRLLRVGLGQPYLQPPLSPTTMPFPWYAKYRWLYRLLRVECEAHAGHGRWSAAVSSACDLAAFSGQIEHGGGTACRLVGDAGYSMAMDILRRLLPYLDREALGVALRRWSEAVAKQPAMSVVAAAELDICEGFCKAAFAEPDWREGLSWLADEGYTPEQVAAVTPEHNAAAMAAFRARLLPLVDEPFGSVPLPPPPDDALADFLTQTLPAHWAIHQLALARQQVLLADLAVAAYQRAHGRLPAGLAELVPDYLATAPQDPFTGGPLTYDLVGDGYQIYSVGPNRQDDGGQAFAWPGERSDGKAYLTAAGDVSR